MDKRIGPYALQELLGRGGQATVYKAVDTRNGTTWTLKLTELSSTDPDKREKTLRRCRDEVFLLLHANHRNIVRIRETKETDTLHIIVLEYLDGIQLLEVLRLRGVVSPVFVIEIALQICSALDHLHTLRQTDGTPLEAVHRDLKPENLILCRDGRVVLIDFGIAKRKNAYFTPLPNETLGSPRYMTPEQALGEHEKTDNRSDLFALGGILVELLTTVHPFGSSSSILVTMQDVISQVDPRRREACERLVEHQAEDFIPIIDSLIQRDPIDRRASAKTLIVALENMRRQRIGVLKIQKADLQARFRQWANTLIAEHREEHHLPPPKTLSM